MDDLTFKWLGISGVEFKSGGETILVDPVFSRVPLRRAVFGRIRPDEEAVRSHVSRCEHIFITHSHYDHLMDAPLVSALAGAALHGSKNTCAIALACGAPADRVYEMKPGERMETAAFCVTALPASHIRLPWFGYGAARQNLAPPLRARQYGMDVSFVFLVRSGGYSVLVGPGLCTLDPGPVDALLCDPIYLRGSLAEYVRRLKPRAFVPIHWEDMFRPAGKPPRPGVVPGFPPRRIDMEKVERQAVALGVRYLLAERGREYALKEMLEWTEKSASQSMHNI